MTNYVVNRIIRTRSWIVTARTRLPTFRRSHLSGLFESREFLSYVRE